MSSNDPSPSKNPAIRKKRGAETPRKQASQSSGNRKDNTTSLESDGSVQAQIPKHAAICGKGFTTPKGMKIHQSNCANCKRPTSNGKPSPSPSVHGTIEEAESEGDEGEVERPEQTMKESRIENEKGLQIIESNEEDEEVLSKSGSEADDRSGIEKDVQDGRNEEDGSAVIEGVMQKNGDEEDGKTDNKEIEAQEVSRRKECSE